MARTSAKRAATKNFLSNDEEQLRQELEKLTSEIVSALFALDTARRKELLGDFVSGLFLSMAKQEQKMENRQKQAEGIAAAKARGIRYGRPALPLPDNFDEIHRAWRGGEFTLGQAADACGMPQSSFYAAAVRRERAADCAG